MRAIDTNVLARFILNDDPAQTTVAEAIIAEGVIVPLTVLLELGWLLLSRFNQPRDTVANVLSALLEHPAIEVERRDAVHWAIECFRAGADLPDVLHIVAAGSATAFSTFDAGVTRRTAGSPIPIETLTA